jgi:DNA-binding IclR family transcriptional regulator
MLYPVLVAWRFACQIGVRAVVVDVPESANLTGADRVLRALRLLAAHPRGVRLEDFSRELGAPKSTTHRVLRTLSRAGFASQDEHGWYRLSLEFLGLAFGHYESLDDRRLVQAVLEALVERFSETAYYGKLDGVEVVYVAMVTAPGSLHTASVVGARLPAFRTALGKAMLAYSLTNRTAVDRFVEQYGPLRASTPNSLTNAAALDRDLAATRSRGYALDNEENETGVNCIAFPVFLGPASRPTGAISVAAIKLRTPLVELATHADEIGEMIERQLGYGAVKRDRKLDQA